MDTFARGLKMAAAIRADGRLAELVRERYASWDEGVGAEIEAGKHTLKSLEALALQSADPVQRHSGRQEFIENLVNDSI